MTEEIDIDDETIEASRDFALALMNDLDDELPEEYDHGAVVFAMFISCIHILIQYGWTKEQLIDDVHIHEALETTEGPVQ